MFERVLSLDLGITQGLQSHTWSALLSVKGCKKLCPEATCPQVVETPGALAQPDSTSPPESGGHVRTAALPKLVAFPPPALKQPAAGAKEQGDISGRFEEFPMAL